jgi:chromosomal replication initiation ATPase DnaA
MIRGSKSVIPSRPCGRAFLNVAYRLDALEAMVAATFAVPLAALRGQSRGCARAAFARQSAMYLAHVVFGLTCADVGRLFGRDRTTAAHACRVIEDRREDPFFDAVLTALEASCGAPREVAA